MNPLISMIIFGWPLYVIAVLTAVFGVYNRQWVLVFLSALLIGPFTYYLNGIPPFAGFALLLPVFHLASAFATNDDNDIWAWILIFPTIVVRMWLLVVAFTVGNLS